MTERQRPVPAWIEKEINKWHDDPDEIGREFFRTGLYTHLYISPVRPVDTHTLELQWYFTFADMGSNHLIEKRFQFNGNELVDTSSGGRTVIRNHPHLRSLVFDHYKPYMQSLYKTAGVSARGGVSSMKKRF